MKIDALMDSGHKSDVTGDKAILSSEILSSRLCKSAERVPNSASLPNVSRKVQVCQTCPKNCKSAERVPNSAGLPNVSQTVQVCRTCLEQCKSAEPVPSCASLPNVNQTVQVCRTCAEQCKSAERVPSTLLFKQPHKRKSQADRKGERADQEMWPAISIFFGKVPTANEVWTVDLRYMCLLNDIPS